MVNTLGSLRHRAPTDSAAARQTISVKPSAGPSKAPHALKTLTWMEIPHWQQDNEHILSGYRRVQNNWRGCIASVFAYLHNETVNIHSHLWGAVLFIYFLVSFYPTYVQPHGSTTWKDVAVFVIFLTSAVFCLGASALYHTSGCHSEKVATRCHAYDYSGIVVLTVGSFYPCLYYGFFCHAHFQAFYLISMTLAGLGAAYIVLNPEYGKPSHRGARTAVFIGLGLCAVVPVSHLIATHGASELLAEMGFGWLLASGALYIIGALLYANRIPERLAPGVFDYFLASHQIFHVCVVLAALAHYKCVLTCLQYRLLQPLVCGK
ncbi:hemolysin-III related-domain-containing protein [Crucibulum laeve]|uniref:Hemolysin-III related-domain-containing protein n=1 Tax=Crucibulum laeve TaxID=68775 RepID=A0A5C3LNX3_9AGAR|nr:hemolysin-III related-domain-containing protein [Crucibulum laeve]